MWCDNAIAGPAGRRGTPSSFFPPTGVPSLGESSAPDPPTNSSDDDDALVDTPVDTPTLYEEAVLPREMVGDTFEEGAPLWRVCSEGQSVGPGERRVSDGVECSGKVGGEERGEEVAETAAVIVEGGGGVVDGLGRLGCRG